MKVEFFDEEKEVYEVCKKGGKHKYYTIFSKEPVGVVNEDTDEIRAIHSDHEEFVKKSGCRLARVYAENLRKIYGKRYV